DVFAGKKSAQIREILISESTWEEMTCLFAPSLNNSNWSDPAQRPNGLDYKSHYLNCNGVQPWL
ncbi:hypothetical protein ACRWC5_14590, partial [Escherichia coli]